MVSDVWASRCPSVATPTAPGKDLSEEEICKSWPCALACRQEAKSLELRAAMSLSRLWQQQGKRADAYELLAPVYGLVHLGL